MIDERIKMFLGKVRATGKDVRIVPATKTRSPEEINELLRYGINSMGENRVQELLEKYDRIKLTDIHFIGALQTNKVKYIVDKVSCIQSLDRPELAREIEKRCAAIDKVMDVLIEVNVGGEESKSGCTEIEFLELAKMAESMPHIKVKGLMSVLPIGAEEQLYLKMKALSDELVKVIPGADILSVGMSDDYEIAIRCGANMIRPGTAIFGPRIYPEAK